MNMNKDKTSAGLRIIPQGENKCIWMDAGIVNYKLCTNQFQCSTCSFDRAMLNQVEKEKRIFAESDKSMYTRKPRLPWTEKFRALPADQRKCRYMLMGEVSFKVCPNNFDCGNCTFDQMMQDRPQPGPELHADQLEMVAGFYISDRLNYFRNHLWINLERNGKYRIGIDDMARRIIGKATGLDMPRVGTRLDFEEFGLTIRHEYGDIDLFSPVKGTVDQVNPDILDHANLVCEQPYESGWLMLVEPDSIAKSNRNFLQGKAAKSWLIDEADQLVRSVQGQNATLHDGAEITMDLSSHLDPGKWRQIVNHHLQLG